MKYVTNIYPITNLSEISGQYRIFDIKGLRKNKDYQANRQWLIDKLSKQLRHPITIINIDNEPKLIVKNDENILSRIDIENDFGRLYLHFYLSDQVFDINFINPSIEVKEICIRFLQFDINGQLKKHPHLWQAYTGGPFFLKKHETINSIAIYKGFTFRVIELPQSGFGIILDATRKFTSSQPLNVYITKEDYIKKYKNSKELKSFLYKYNDWYEIQPTERDDFNVSEFKINGISLIDHVRNVIPKPHSLELANLPNDSSVLTYYTSNGETRGAPSGLLYQVLDFQDTNNAEVNRKSLISPEMRFEEIRDYKWNYFYNLKYHNSILKFDNRTLEVPNKIFEFPDFELGNHFILEQSKFTKANELAKERFKKLLDPRVGFYTTSTLPNQILVLPRSINDTSGEIFISNLKKTTDQMYPSDTYNPEIIPYEDKFAQGMDYITIGKHIIDTVKNCYNRKGVSYGLIVIPRLEKKSKREHDKLSALVVKEFEKMNIHCSVIHTDTINDSFESNHDKSGRLYYNIKPDRKRRLDGYTRNVSISKILLNCNKWPFALRNPLNADITIGIDVKHHTAGYTIIDKYCKNIRTDIEETKNKEKLSADQLKTRLYLIVKNEYNIDQNIKISKIVLHRDGRLFDEELEGLLAGLQQLKEEMILPEDANINIIEIPKTSYLSIRFFELNWDNKLKKFSAANPPNGLHYFLKNEAFICSTGKEFAHEGTSNPLQVKFISGNMSKEELLLDLFNFTTLAFTKPDDCSRLPITIKINDIKLNDAASEYDEDNLYQLNNLLENNNIKIQ